MPTLNFILVTVTYRLTATQTERMVAFPWQQWLREYAEVLLYAYIAYLVSEKT
jgi:hypothetical protein